MLEKQITVLTPCYNEVENVEPLFRAVQQAINTLKGITYSHLFIDNASTDGTRDKLRELASKHKHIQVILNNRNFGHIRSPWYGLMQAEGDAVIEIVCDFQQPPELIPIFVKHWLNGFPVVIGIRERTKGKDLLWPMRAMYYRFTKKLADVELIEHFNGFVLYDRQVIETMRELPDMYPYSRGLVAELGFSYKRVPYMEQMRRRGISKNNFYSLYDMAILGITSHSKIPLRLAIFIGFSVSVLSLMIGIVYFVYKLMFFERFEAGIAPLVVGLFFFGAVQLFFIGIIGEYIGSIHTQVLKRPMVVEKERINFSREYSDYNKS